MRNEVDVDWSADGKQLVFGRVSEQASTEPINIQLFDLATGHLSALPESDNLFSPRWSPDGRYIAALTKEYKTLLRFDVLSGEWSKWVEAPESIISFPAWSDDSKYIYYENVGEYRRIGLDQTQSEFVASLKNIRLFNGRWGTWSTVAPGGAPMFCARHQHRGDLCPGRLLALASLTDSLPFRTVITNSQRSKHDLLERFVYCLCSIKRQSLLCCR